MSTNMIKSGEITKKELINLLISNMDLGKNEIERFYSMLNSISNEDFCDCISKMALKVVADSSDKGIDTFINLLKDKKYNFGGKVENSETSILLPITYVPKVSLSEIQRKIISSHVTDTIILTKKEKQELEKLWRPSNITDDNLTIPSDIFFAETIPIKDCKIKVDDEKPYRVIIFEDYIDQLKSTKNSLAIIIGAIIIDNYEEICIPLYISKGNNSIICGKFEYHNPNSNDRNLLEKELSIEKMFLVKKELLATWYGIQIALLHPVIKEVFRNTRLVIERDPITKRTAQKKNKVRYIKEHIINAEDLEYALYGKGNNSINRHALVWHVIGHWRTYKNGKSIFIQPYWKGILRQTKIFSEERDREIVINHNPNLYTQGCVTDM